MAQDAAGTPRIANPIYAEVVPRHLNYAVQAGLPQHMAWYVDAGGGLDVEGLIAAFQEFFREHSEHWVQRFEQYHEAGPQLLLQAHLQRIVNGGGRIEREYALGRGRTDLLIVWPQGGRQRRFVVECKVLRRGLERTIAEGMEQTRGYAILSKNLHTEIRMNIHCLAFFVLTPNGQVPVSLHPGNRWTPPTWSSKLQEGVHYHDKPPVNGPRMTVTDFIQSFEITSKDDRSSGMPGAHEQFKLTDRDDVTIDVELQKPDPFIPSNQLPYPDGLRIVEMSDSAQRIPNLRSGKLDINKHIGLNGVDRDALAKTNPEIRSMGG